MLADKPNGLPALIHAVVSLGLPELDPARLAPALLRHSGGNPLFALETLRDLVLSGDTYVITCGEPMGDPGATNMLKVCRVG